MLKTRQEKTKEAEDTPDSDCFSELDFEWCLKLWSSSWNWRRSIRNKVTEGAFFAFLSSSVISLFSSVHDVSVWIFDTSHTQRWPHSTVLAPLLPGNIWAIFFWNVGGRVSSQSAFGFSMVTLCYCQIKENWLQAAIPAGRTGWSKYS